MEHLSTILQHYGLSHKEAKVYLALLTLGSSTANILAEKTDLIRTTTYDILKALREKGIVSSITKNKILYFEAVDPSVLIALLEERKKELKEVLPQLQKLRLPSSPKPVVELYDGKEGIKSIYQDIIQERKPLSAISNTHYVFQVLPFFVPHFIHSRIKRKIPIRLLNEKTKESASLMKAKDNKELRETRFISELKNIPITEYIYGEKVAILKTNPRDPLGVIIRDKDFAHSQKLLFELLWKKAEK